MRAANGRRTFMVAAIAGVLSGSVAVGGADPETVPYPARYRSAFVEYGVVDAIPAKRVRIYYVAPEVLDAAVPGRRLPDGSVLVMEVRDARLDPDGQPLRDVGGRFIAGDRVVGLWVQAKIGGAWHFARFNADGSRVTHSLGGQVSTEDTYPQEPARPPHGDGRQTVGAHEGLHRRRAMSAYATPPWSSPLSASSAAPPDFPPALRCRRDRRARPSRVR
jgi:hypothetical protein